MNTSKRPDIAPKTARNMPGPGSYASPTKIGKDTPSHSIRSGRKDLNKDFVPGPGAYNDTDTLLRDKSPSFRLGSGKRSEIVSKESATSPAPGHYYQKSTIGVGPKYTINSRNEPKLRDNTPGPGVYDSDANFVKDRIVSHKMTSSQRPDIVSKED